MRIALTGGIACGKSLLARYLSNMGLAIIDADDVVHELEAPGGAAVEPIVERFGRDVLAPDGGIDRRRLAEAVFGGIEKGELRMENSSVGGPPSLAAAARRDLEAILFPMVKRRIDEFLDGRQSTAGAQCTTIDVQQPTAGTQPHSQFSILNSQFSISIIPLLFESHWDADYDIIIALVSEHEAQVRRMAETRGQSREEAEARIAAQMPVEEKAARADYVIRNDSTPQALHAEAVRLVEWLESRTRG